MDRVIAVSGVTVKCERGVPFGIENDEITGGKRLVSSHDGQTIMDWQKPLQPMRLSGSWVNVDSRLSVVAIEGSGMTYVQASRYSPSISVYSDTLYSSYSDQTRHFTVGEEIARRITVFFVEVTPKQTAELAASCRIEERAGGHFLRFEQPGGVHYEIPLIPGVAEQPATGT